MQNERPAANQATSPTNVPSKTRRSSRRFSLLFLPLVLPTISQPTPSLRTAHPVQLPKLHFRPAPNPRRVVRRPRVRGPFPLPVFRQRRWRRRLRPRRRRHRRGLGAGRTTSWPIWCGASWTPSPATPIASPSTSIARFPPGSVALGPVVLICRHLR